jgi:radical SAM protein with 4Fe4S-binding SPASM domain
VLNPKYRLTKQKSSIILHSARLAGAGSYVQGISALEAVILALYDGTRSPADVSRALAVAPGISKENSQNVMTLTRHFTDQRILVDVDTLRHRPSFEVYNPLEFAFDAQVKPVGARLDQPLGLTYLPTLSCNRFCKYCYARAGYLKGEERVPFQRLAQIIDEASGLGIRSVNISGGEPFLRPDLPQILAYMISKNLYPTVSTKAALSECVVRQLSEAGLEDIQVSLDSPEPSTADLLVGTPHYFHEITTTIRLLAKYKIKVRLNCLVTAYTIKQIPSLVSLAAGLDVSAVALSPYFKTLGRHADDLFPSPEDQQQLNLMLPRLRSENRGLRITDFRPGEPAEFPGDSALPPGPGCSVGLVGFVILPNGEVSVCERLAYDRTFIMGDLNKQSMMDVWSSPKWDELCNPGREPYKETECFSCEAFEACTRSRRRCFVNTKLVYGRVYGPEPTCPRVHNSGGRLV